MYVIIESLNNMGPPIFNNWFTFRFGIYDYQAASSSASKLFKPSYRNNPQRQNFVIITDISS